MKLKPIILVLFMLMLEICLGWELEQGLYISGKYVHQEGTDRLKISGEYYPAWQKTMYKSGEVELDINLELQGVADFVYEEAEVDEFYDLELYRFWLRSSAEQSEFRLGLQKINFGPAIYLRSLQWFDRLNALDPRQQTEGVKAALARYYSLDNSNYWFWAIYDESDLKGSELIKSRAETIEMGGRIQLPLLGGEAGVSVHNRAVEVPLSESKEKLYSDSEETRIGLDGQWDIGIGLWFESSLGIYDNIPQLALYNEYYTAGADYTFGLGNGLHILYEHQYIRLEDKFWKGKNKVSSNYSLMAADYPLGLYDSISGVMGWDHKEEAGYYYLSWQRAWDYVSIYVNISKSQSENIQDGFWAAGETLQLLLQINF